MRLRNKKRERRAAEPETIDTHYCDQCERYVITCEHEPNGIQRAGDVARKVARVAEAGAHLADGIDRAISGAASILGGRWGGR